MAGDWIKMRLSLVSHPKVMRIAEHLLENGAYLEWAQLSYGVPSFPCAKDDEVARERYASLRVTRYVTVGALLRFWGYANEHAKDDESIEALWPEDVDEIAGIPGFATALERVDWIKFDVERNAALLPNFLKHNVLGRGSSSAAERQKRYRERKKQDTESDVNRDVTHNVTTLRREEKRREHINTKKRKSPLPADFCISSSVQVWADSKGIFNLPQHLEQFVNSCKAKGYEYIDWDRAFMGAVTKDWARIGKGVDPDAPRRVAT